MTLFGFPKGVIDQPKTVIRLKESLGSVHTFLPPDEEYGVDMTVPGYNYLGPGTPVYSNVTNDLAPVSEIDRVSMVHDIEYLAVKQYYADWNYLLNLQQHGTLIDNLLWRSVTGTAFQLKEIIPGLSSYLAADNYATYIALRDMVIAKKWVAPNYFYEYKDRASSEPSIQYKLQHPYATITVGHDIWIYQPLEEVVEPQVLTAFS